MTLHYRATILSISGTIQSVILFVWSFLLFGTSFGYIQATPSLMKLEMKLN